MSELPHQITGEIHGEMGFLPIPYQSQAQPQSLPITSTTTILTNYKHNHNPYQSQAQPQSLPITSTQKFLSLL